MCSKKVGYWISEKKSKKLNFKEFEYICNKSGIFLYQINLEEDLEKHGQFDLIIHKLTDIIAKADQHELKSLLICKKFQDYFHHHPETIVLDQFNNVRLLLNRFYQYKLVRKALHPIKDLVDAPNFTMVNLRDRTAKRKDNQKLFKLYNVRYPLICKPIEAHGSHRSHEMALVFDENHLYSMATEYNKLNIPERLVDDASVPTLTNGGASAAGPPSNESFTFVVQSFINHNASLYKVFVIGDRHFVVKRPSLKNFYPGDYDTIFFKSNEVSRADACSDLTELDEESIEFLQTSPIDICAFLSNDDEDQVSELEQLEQQQHHYKPELYLDLDPILTRRIIHVLRESFKLSLFGIDIIRDSRTGKYYVIDINAFPGYDGVPNFFKYLLRLIRIKLGLKIPKNDKRSKNAVFDNTKCLELVEDKPEVMECCNNLLTASSQPFYTGDMKFRENKHFIKPITSSVAAGSDSSPVESTLENNLSITNCNENLANYRNIDSKQNIFSNITPSSSSNNTNNYEKFINVTSQNNALPPNVINRRKLTFMA